MTKPRTLGNFELSIVTDGAYLADGGAMFGVVPKVPISTAPRRRVSPVSIADPLGCGASAGKV